MNTEPQTIKPKPVSKAWFHVDMDGLDAIYQGHGLPYNLARDDFYTSAVDNSLSFFAQQGVMATYFLIARDLDDPHKRPAIERVVDAGHRIASHSLNHKYLYKITSDQKREEIFASKQKIEDTLGVACEGFRAPGYSIDTESLHMLSEAGYRYDSSVYPNYAFRKRLGINRLFPEPFALFPENNFFEIPMPSLGLGLPPFHPCYAFYLSRWYSHLALRAFRKRFNYLTYLFHFTDFADPQPHNHGIKLNVFTNNYFSRDCKLRFLAKLVKPIRDHFEITTTEEFLSDWPDSAPDLNPRTILGIATTHETGACIVRDGKVLSAISEERISRIKLDNRFPPKRAIRQAIRVAGIQPSDIDAVAISGLHWTDLIPQSLDSFRQDFKDYHAFNDYFPHFCRIFYRVFYLWRAMAYGRVSRYLKREYGVAPKVFHVEHHEAHASSVYRTGDHDDALIVTADGVGDDVCITFSHAHGSLIQRAETFFYPNSFGQFYTACTQILGFKAGRHEGKITGLAGYGKPNQQLINAVEQTFFNHDGGFRLNKYYYSEGFLRIHIDDVKKMFKGQYKVISADYRNYKMPLKRLLQGYSREDVAHAFQHLLEREMVRLTRRHMRDDQALHLMLAGGIFANVKLNMAMSHDLDAESIFIFPAMGDGGLCVGAALSVPGTTPSSIPNVYLGTEHTDREIDEALKRHPTLSYTKPDDIAQCVAQALADKKIVARCAGRMEYGPRALGNRSILYHCADRSVNDWLNEQLNRTEFMPFAPMALWEDADEYFLLKDGEKRACEFMTLVARCTEKMIQACPAAVHVDGTARPQLVRRDLNPGMYDILVAYKKITGISCVINTSFNMHEEPIVESPHDAISAFQQSKIDHLVLGPYFVQATSASSQDTD